MKTVGLRSVVLYILLLAVLAGVAFFGFELIAEGSEWVAQPYNTHLSVSNLGEIKDTNGNPLAYTSDGVRCYSDSEVVRMALLHTVGDTESNISTSVEYTMAGRLSGYNLITGLAQTPLSVIGKDVTLTVDQDVCTAAYYALNGHNGAAIVYNYKTGDIVCKVSTPTYDPLNIPEDIETNDEYDGVYIDNTLSSSYTPGSIFKLVVCAAAMEKWPDTWSSISYDCSGSMEIGGDDITCLNGTSHGTQDIYEALGNSCNVFFAQLASDIGAEALQAKAEEMGFNTQLMFGDIEICESEIDLSDASENQLAWAGVGQYTVLTNPYHMMVLMGAIANGGTYTQPKLTEDLELFDSLSGDRTLLSSTQAAQLKDLMRNNVEDYYGDWMFPDGLRVCAKTGTGEVGEGKAPNCWIVGFCENTDYPYAFAIIVEEGSGGIESAGNAAAAILSALVS